jgi:uncharacterized protein YkwD
MYPTAQSAHDGWMGSPGHRSNMLNPGWQRVGIGMVPCGMNALWTEDFMR